MSKTVLILGLLSIILVSGCTSNNNGDRGNEQVQNTQSVSTQPATNSVQMDGYSVHVQPVLGGKSQIVVLRFTNTGSKALGLQIKGAAIT
jgi:hypothetical protein